MKNHNTGCNKIFHNSHNSNTNCSATLSPTKVLYHKSKFSPTFFRSSLDITIKYYGNNKINLPVSFFRKRSASENIPVILKHLRKPTFYRDPSTFLKPNFELTILQTKINIKQSQSFDSRPYHLLTLFLKRHLMIIMKVAQRNSDKEEEAL